MLVSNSGSLAISGNITDDGLQRPLTLGGDGTGTLVLSGSNSYRGGTNVQSGTLIAESPAALPNGSSLSVGAGASQLFGSGLTGSPIVSNVTAVLAVSGVSAVPEPGTLALLLAGLVAGFAGVPALAGKVRKGKRAADHEYMVPGRNFRRNAEGVGWAAGTMSGTMYSWSWSRAVMGGTRSRESWWAGANQSTVSCSLRPK